MELVSREIRSPANITVGRIHRRERERRMSGRWIKVSLEVCRVGWFLVEAVGIRGDRRSLRKWRFRVICFCGYERQESSVRYWEQLLVLVGTGYRIRFGEGGRERERDLGYGHSRNYSRIPGRGVERTKQPRGRRLFSEGVGARERVIVASGTRERLRPRSVYTGCGLIRPGHYGKQKPTKGSG